MFRTGMLSYNVLKAESEPWRSRVVSTQIVRRGHTQKEYLLKIAGDLLPPNDVAAFLCLPSNWGGHKEGARKIEEESAWEMHMVVYTD